MKDFEDNMAHPTLLPDAGMPTLYEAVELIHLMSL